MKYIPNAFQIHNGIVDDFIHILSHSELKCYLAVIRKTTGWGKKIDSMPVSQLQEITGIKKRDTIFKAMKNLEKYGLISITHIPGQWTKYSPKTPIGSPTQRDGGSPTQRDGGSPTQRDTSKPTNSKPTNSKDRVPSIEEIIEYIKQKQLSVNAKDFFEYFEAGNWVDSNGRKVKNWKQKLLTWNAHSKNTTGTKEEEAWMRYAN